MQELLGRLTALDSEAREGLKVISYFDALVAGDVGLETLARGAALLSGVPSGIDAAGRRVRVDTDGRLAETEEDPRRWPGAHPAPDEYVWIERAGEAHVNDAMILERFSLAVSVLQARRRTSGENPLVMLLDSARSERERLSCAVRLRLENGLWRVVASLPDSKIPGPGTVIATSCGILRATVVAPDTEIAVEPIGIGTAAPAADLTASWDEAQLALRLVDRERPRVDAADLGIMLTAIQLFEREGQKSGVQHRDVRALSRLEPQRRHLLEALTRGSSIRSAASAMGMHHSTLQFHHEALTQELGYDPRSPEGRVRYELASQLARISASNWSPVDVAGLDRGIPKPA